ncbi:hypothetical protein [Edwardsiella phage PEi26]|nr:hypothetical protein [Edwardsiella phage PEi26]
MKLRIVDGYLEVDGLDGTTCIALSHVAHSIYGTDYIRRAVAVYHRQQPDPFTWPDMSWDPIRCLWTKIISVDSPEFKMYELDAFIQMCRRNQNVS